jgi:hypothetical protein
MKKGKYRMLKHIALMGFSIAAASAVQAKEVNFTHPPVDPLLIQEYRTQTVQPQDVLIVENKVVPVTPVAVVVPTVEQKRIPLRTTVGYTNNNVAKTTGLYTAVGTETLTKIPVRIQAQGTFDVENDWKNQSYGATLGVPLTVTPKVKIVPQVAYDRYENVPGETGTKDFYSVGSGLEYELAPSVTANATAMYTPNAEEDKGQSKESYMFTVTKAW